MVAFAPVSLANTAVSASARRQTRPALCSLVPTPALACASLRRRRALAAREPRAVSGGSIEAEDEDDFDWGEDDEPLPAKPADAPAGFDYSEDPDASIADYGARSGPSPYPGGADEDYPGWTVEYLYDGACSTCRNLRGALAAAQKGKGEGARKVRFIDLSRDDGAAYVESDHAGVSWEDAMRELHAVTRQGEVLKGTEALNTLYDAAGLGWLARAAQLPGVAGLVEGAVGWVSKNRLGLGLSKEQAEGAMAGLVAARRARMENAGEAVPCGAVDPTTGEDAPCETEVEWDEVDDLEAFAAAERARLAAEKGG